MKWISIKDKIPNNDLIIVAIMQGRQEQNGDPIEDAEIVILRGSPFGEWRNMDETEIFYLPNVSEYADYYKTINYWMPYDKFIFPESMIIKDSK